MKGLAIQMEVYYKNKFPGIEFSKRSSGIVAIYRGTAVQLESLTSIDNTLMEVFEPLIPKDEPVDDQTLQHTHSEETWDEYRTKSGSIVAVEYNEGQLRGIHFRFGVGVDHSQWGSLKISDLEAAQQLLAATHAALASIAKKEINSDK